MTLDAILTLLAWPALALAGLYAAVTLANLAVFRAPARPAPGAPRPRVSVLIPARDEAANIEAALAAVLASEGVDLEAVVLDDGSTDGTPRLVEALAARDGRVRLIRGAALPAGLVGKQHACAQLGAAAREGLMVFVDADVRLAPGALARMAAYMDARGLDLVSGFPRQVTGTLGEALVIPQILVLLLGYLPLPMARRSDRSGFAAGCGQLIAVRRAAYEAAGGHRAFARLMHDGLMLPRNVREAGGRTDILDATPIATCRMYDTWAGVWHGFSKNATEGMAKPLALPIWTILLGGGHVLPFALALLAALSGAALALKLSLLAIALVMGARVLLALKVRQSALSVLLHPFGMGVVLAIQWNALLRAGRGRQASWRGRTYDV